MTATGRLNAASQLPWFVAARLLAALGGGLYLLKATLLATGGVPGPLSQPNMPPVIDVGFILAYALVGAAGLAHALRARSLTDRMAIGLVLAAMLGILLDVSGITALPWVIPGLVLLVAAVVTYALRNTSERREAPGTTRALGRVAAGIGLLVQALVGVSFLPFGLGVPAYGMLALYVVWGLMLALAFRVRRTHPWAVLAIPPVTFALMYRLVLLGGEMLGWAA